MVVGCRHGWRYLAYEDFRHKDPLVVGCRHGVQNLDCHIRYGWRYLAHEDFRHKDTMVVGCRHGVQNHDCHIHYGWRYLAYEDFRHKDKAGDWIRHPSSDQTSHDAPNYTHHSIDGCWNETHKDNADQRNHHVGSLLGSGHRRVLEPRKVERLRNVKSAVRTVGFKWLTCSSCLLVDLR